MLMLWPWILPVRALGHTSGVDAVIVGTVRPGRTDEGLARFSVGRLAWCVGRVMIRRYAKRGLG